MVLFLLALALPPLDVETTGSELKNPVSIVFVGSWGFAVEQEGRVIALWEGKKRAVVLDITDRVASGGERGLLSIAFGPGHYLHPSAKWIYVNYTDRKSGGATVVSAFPINWDSDPSCRVFSGPKPGTTCLEVDKEGEVVLLDIEQPWANHNGGQIAFGPDGFLYIGMGDGGAGGDPKNSGQDNDSLLGAILRIDPTPWEKHPYKIPKDNPFAHGVGGRTEILHWGVRNPWRFSFDRATGDLWIGDVGQNKWEEVDRVPAGAVGLDLGWKVLEGSHCFEPAWGCKKEGRLLPLYEYDHTEGASISGGFVYRGKAIPELVGWYLFSDFAKSWIRAIDTAHPQRGAVTLDIDFGGGIVGFGEDAEGEIHIVTHWGTIAKIVPRG